MKKLFIFEIPPSERSTIPPAAQAGSNIGIVVTTPIVSIMIAQNFLGGWPSAFYVFGKSFLQKSILNLINIYFLSGFLSCLWFIGWIFFAFSTPDEHPRISQEERIYLRKHITTSTLKVSK
jgi:hypothetical protein